MVFILLLVGCVWFGCPIWRFLHVPCPCCGVTRAWLCFLQGDFSRAVRYHACFWLLPPLLLFGFHRRFLPKRAWADGILIGAAVLLFGYHVFRMMNGYGALLAQGL